LFYHGCLRNASKKVAVTPVGIERSWFRSHASDAARTLSSSHLSLRYTHGLARKFAGGIIDAHERDLPSEIRLDGFLSFAPGSDALELQPLNVLTGEPDAVIACERHGAATMLQRLDPKKLGRWLDDYRLGELWRMGELGANP
jgi:hypothetical protein